MHPDAFPCFTCTCAWHVWHEPAARVGACGMWQLVQNVCAGAVAATSVGFTP
jgi:hypothetical protein